jgi:hypothetical protein
VANVIRYRVNGENSVLRSVLYDLWAYKCYWCSRPKDYNDVQIDHIIPQTMKDEQLQELAKQFRLPADFDVHDPYNLAPICSSCNGPGGKSDEEFVHVPVVLNRLRKAEKLRSTVIKRVQTFAAPGKTAAALILAKEADLSSPTTRQAFETYAPAVVQKLVLLDEVKAEDFVSFGTAKVQVDGDPRLKVGVSLDARARRATTILEDVCGGTLEDVIQGPVVDLFWKIHKNVQDAFEAFNGPAGPTVSGPPVSDFVRIDVDSICFERTGPFFEFTFGGDFEASLSASLLQDSRDGGELIELQGDNYVMGRFSFVATWDSSENGDIEADECLIESWHSEL